MPDWELWPWMVADAADESGYALAMRRMEVGMRRMEKMIGAALYPALRRYIRA